MNIQRRNFNNINSNGIKSLLLNMDSMHKQLR